MYDLKGIFTYSLSFYPHTSSGIIQNRCFYSHFKDLENWSPEKLSGYKIVRLIVTLTSVFYLCLKNVWVQAKSIGGSRSGNVPELLTWPMEPPFISDSIYVWYGEKYLDQSSYLNFSFSRLLFLFFLPSFSFIPQIIAFFPLHSL